MANKPTAHDVEPDIKKDEQGMERLVFFSDAVFAIVVTLLALELRLPEGVEYSTDAELWQGLLTMWPAFLAYLLSFVVVGHFWVSHHRKFQYIVHYDKVLIYVNLAMLMVVAVVPFVSNILSEYPYRIAVVLYAGTMMIASLLSGFTNWYAVQRHLTSPTVTRVMQDLLLFSPFKTAGVFLLSIIIAQWNPIVAMFSWLLLIPASIDFGLPKVRRAAQRTAPRKG